MSSTYSRSAIVALLAGAVTLSLAATATAESPGQLAVDGTTLRFEAAAGAVNDVRVVAAGSWIVVSDDRSALVAASPCVQAGANTAVCPATGVSQLAVELGDLDDRVRNESPLDGTLSAGDGDDQLAGGPGTEAVLGGPGDDTILGSYGADVLDGQDGRADLVTFEHLDVPVAVTTDDQPNDAVGRVPGVNVTSRNENINGGPGNDVLKGVGPTANTIKGGAGEDEIWGGDGADKLYGEDGPDTIFGENDDDLLDGGADTDYGDGGADTDTCLSVETALSC